MKYNMNSVKSFRCCFEQAREAIYRMKKYLRMFNFENGRQPITNSEGAKATYMCATKFTTGTNFSPFFATDQKIPLPALHTYGREYE